MSKFILTDACFKARGGVHAPAPKPLTKLVCARRDTAAFQLVCDAGGGRCILNPGRSPALSFELNLPRYRVEVKSPFASRIYAEGYLRDENGIPCADILHEEAQTYDGGLYAPAYIELAVPESAVPGEYEARVRIYRAVGAQDETLEAERTLSLRVCGFSMPSPREYACHLDLWQHNANIARTYGVELWSEEHFSLMEQVVAALAELGQKSVTVLAGDCPWRGWGCYLLKDTPATLFEYSMAQIRKTADGNFHYDFRILKRYIDLCSSHGINGDVTVYGLAGIWTNMPLFNGAVPEDYPEQVLIRYLDESDGCYKYLRRTEDIKKYIAALFAFFRREGIFGKVRIAADEPSNLEAYERNIALLKEIDPETRFKMALDKTSAIERFGARTADVAASFPCACKHARQLKELKERDSQKRLLWYVCNIPDKPNTTLKNELAEARVLGCMAYLFGFDGFLRWAFTCWTKEPLKDIRYNNASLPAGDISLVYPAKDGRLLCSLRYKALKKGIEDYELLSRLKKAGKAETAQKALDLVLIDQNPETYMKTDFLTKEAIFFAEYEQFERFRALIFEALEKEAQS